MDTIKQSHDFAKKLTALCLIVAFLFATPFVGFAEEQGGETAAEPVVTAPPPTSETPTPETPTSETPEPESAPDAINPANEGNTETTSTESSGPVIVTGDAEAQGEVTNFVNTNDTTTNGTSTSPSVTALSLDGTASTTDATTASTTEATSQETRTGPLEIEVANTGTVGNTMTVEASTGSNTASGTPNSSIDTGSAYGEANVVNVINTNILDSEVFLMFLSNYFSQIGSLDLRFMASTTEDANCGEGCSNPPLSLESYLNSNNIASISNDILVRSGTGGNNILGAGGILTGDAYAAANVINLANTNIVNSNYMLMVFNNFGDWAGDLVLPSADYFESNFSFGGSGSSQNTPSTASSSSAFGDVSNTNDALVTTTGTTSASTGGNEVSGTSTGIRTGRALSFASIINRLNSNYTNTDQLFIVFRIAGRWNGNVFGRPNNVEWRDTGNGLEVYGLGSGETNSNSASVNTINTQNNAAITNNVSVYALTGENKIRGNGDSGISTGNAYAASSVLNLANTNVYGRNWILAIINIFGDWTGNLSFGRPDLWIGSRAEVAGELGPGGSARYVYTISNRGDATARSVKLKNSYDPRLITFENQSGGTSEWHLGDLRPGETIERVYLGTVAPTLPIGAFDVVSTATVTANEPDGNPSDNTDSISILARRQNDYARVTWDAFDPIISVVKTNSATTSITASSTVDYMIKLHNEGGVAYDAVLVDKLFDQDGKLINEQSWDLQDFLAGEEITVTYTSVFSEATLPGVYTNEAYVEAMARQRNIHVGNAYTSPKGTSTITVAGSIAVATPTGGGAGGSEVGENVTSSAASTTTPQTTSNIQDSVARTIQLGAALLGGTTEEDSINGTSSGSYLVSVAEANEDLGNNRNSFAAAFFAAQSGEFDFWLLLLALVILLIIMVPKERARKLIGRFSSFF